MKNILAEAFRLLFQINFFKKRYYGFHKRIFKPYNLFEGVVREATYLDIKLNLHIDDWIQENLFFLGEYELAELQAIKQFLKKGDTFIDVGANIGLFSLHASKLVGDAGQVISFEPYAENNIALIQNVALNGFSNVQVEKLALGEKEDSIKLYYNEQERNRGMVSANPIGTFKETVQVTSLDLYLQKSLGPKIDFMKIDVEGYEFAALQGMKNTLLTFSPTILIEILGDAEGSVDNKKVHDYLYDLGYKKFFINDDGKVSESETEPSRRNYIFTKSK